MIDGERWDLSCKEKLNKGGKRKIDEVRKERGNDVKKKQ